MVGGLYRGESDTQIKNPFCGSRTDEQYFVGGRSGRPK